MGLLFEVQNIRKHIIKLLLKITIFMFQVHHFCVLFDK